MRWPELFAAPGGPHVIEPPGVVRRRRVVVVATLAIGTTVLAGTLAAPPGSGVFFGLGLASAVIWIAGTVTSGPVPARAPGTGPVGPAGVVAPILLGAALFVAFGAAKLLAGQVPVLSGSVASVLHRADSGPRALVLAVAVVNGVGEELFFRGAVHASFGQNHAAIWATAIYCVVTIATLNVALVASALVVGSVLSAERRACGGVLAPIVTHVSWSIMVLLFLPR